MTNKGAIYAVFAVAPVIAWIVTQSATNTMDGRGRFIDNEELKRNSSTHSKEVSDANKVALQRILDGANPALRNKGGSAGKE